MRLLDTLVSHENRPQDGAIESCAKNSNYPVSGRNDSGRLETANSAGGKLFESRRLPSDHRRFLTPSRRRRETDDSFQYLKRTFPRGLDVECFSFTALASAYSEAKLPWEREHVTPFINSRPKRFILTNLESEKDESGYRWTVDTPEGFQLLSLVLDRFSHDLSGFRYRDVLAQLNENPNCQKINAHIEQKTFPPQSPDSASNA